MFESEKICNYHNWKLECQKIGIFSTESSKLSSLRWNGNQRKLYLISLNIRKFKLETYLNDRKLKYLQIKGWISENSKFHTYRSSNAKNWELTWLIEIPRMSENWKI